MRKSHDHHDTLVRIQTLVTLYLPTHFVEHSGFGLRQDLRSMPPLYSQHCPFGYSERHTYHSSDHPSRPRYLAAVRSSLLAERAKMPAVISPQVVRFSLPSSIADGHLRQRHRVFPSCFTIAIVNDNLKDILAGQNFSQGNFRRWLAIVSVGHLSRQTRSENTPSSLNMMSLDYGTCHVSCLGLIVLSHVMWCNSTCHL